MKSSLTQFAVVVTLSLAGAAGTWFLKGSPEPVTVSCDPKTIPEDEICLADVPDGALWIDARLRSEWVEKSVQGSVLWNLDPKEDEQVFEAETATKIVSSQASMVVVFCGSEACDTSRQIAERIRGLGLESQVKVLHGGWDALNLRGSN